MLRALARGALGASRALRRRPWGGKDWRAVGTGMAVAVGALGSFVVLAKEDSPDRPSSPRVAAGTGMGATPTSLALAPERPRVIVLGDSISIEYLHSLGGSLRGFYEVSTHAALPHTPTRQCIRTHDATRCMARTREATATTTG